VQRVVSALGLASSSPSRASLRLVGRPDEASQPQPAPALDDVPGREREKRLVDQSRDAHFALRRRFRELAADVAGTGLELLCDRARRIDDELAGLYQARAAVLTHRLRRLSESDALNDAETPASSPPDVLVGDAPRTTSELSIEERALVMRLRAASDHDRRTLLHLAVRFTNASRTQR
jgi:hypothetical protein